MWFKKKTDSASDDASDDPKPDDLTQTQLFAPLDPDEISRNIRVEARAVEEGKSDVPAPLATYPSDVEQDILEELKRHGRKAEEGYLDRRRSCEDRVRRGVVTDERVAAMKARGEQTLADFKAENDLDLEQLRPFADDAEEREAEVASFKESHDLRRSPRSLSRRDRTALWFLLAFIVLAQFLVSWSLFADLGGEWLEKGARALALSFVNVVAAVVYGRCCLPLVVHRQAVIKVLGGGLLAGFALWLVGLSLAAGHFHDLLIEKAGSASIEQLLTRVLGAGVHLQDADSGLLALLVGTLGVAAAALAFRMGEAYPGFGTVASGRDRAYADLARERRDWLDRLIRRRDRAMEELDTELASVKSDEEDGRQATRELTDLHRDYAAYLDQLADLNRRLTKTYRDENRSARFIAPPSYFSAPVPRPDFLDAAPLPELPEPERNLNPQVVSLFEHFIERIQVEHQRVAPRGEASPDVAAAEHSSA